MFAFFLGLDDGHLVNNSVTNGLLYSILCEWPPTGYVLHDNFKSFPLVFFLLFESYVASVCH
jgi:hypothetical protein